MDVIIPAYNAEKHIGQTIASVLSQTLAPRSIIVVDDGSSDNTATAVKAYHNKKIPIHYYYHQSNSGPSAARNTGLNHASADYIAFVDADDIWLPEKLEKQWKVFATTTYPCLGVVYTDYDYIDDEGAVHQENERRFHFNPSIRGDVFSSLLRVNQIAGSASAVLVKRECFQTVGMFDSNLRVFEDGDMWLRIARSYQFDFVPEVLVRLRRHGSNKTDDYAALFSASLTYYDKWVKEKVVTKAIRSYWYRELFYLLSMCLRAIVRYPIAPQYYAALLRLISYDPITATQSFVSVIVESIRKRTGLLPS